MTPTHGKRPPRSSFTVRHRTQPLSAKLDLDSAFFWLLFTFLLTAFTFFSLRDRHLSLDTSQIAEYDRRAQMLSNSTVYIVEVGRPETLLSALSPADWTRVSTDIDYVAFVWDDLPLFLTDEWVSAAEAALTQNSAQRLQIALFPCGCVLPNRYFQLVRERLHGFECLLLPGWVLHEQDVHWLDLGTKITDTCKRRDSVLGKKLVKEFSGQLKEIRQVVEGLTKEAEANQVLVPGEKTGSGLTASVDRKDGAVRVRVQPAGKTR